MTKSEVEEILAKIDLIHLGRLDATEGHQRSARELVGLFEAGLYDLDSQIWNHTPIPLLFLELFKVSDMADPDRDPCLEPNKIEAFAHGLLKDHECFRIARHLTGCEDCNEIFQAFAHKGDTALREMMQTI